MSENNANAESFAPVPKTAKVTLVKDAIHNPYEPRHFMTVTPVVKQHILTVKGIEIARAQKVWSMSEVAHIIVHPVIYFHKQDIKTEYLIPSELTTPCPLKGAASYYHLKINGETLENAVWTYKDPIVESEIIRELMAFDSRLCSIAIK